MSRKDYEAIASVIRGEIAIAENVYNDDVARRTAVSIARSIAERFAQDNLRFDRSKFYAACGMKLERITHATGDTADFWH